MVRNVSSHWYCNYRYNNLTIGEYIQDQLSCLNRKNWETILELFYSYENRCQRLNFLKFAILSLR